MKKIICANMFAFLLVGLVILNSPNSAAALITSGYTEVKEKSGTNKDWFFVEFKVNWSNSNKTACSSVSINLWNEKAPNNIQYGRVKIYFKDGKYLEYDFNGLEKGKKYQKTYQGTCTDVAKAEFLKATAFPQR